MIKSLTHHTTHTSSKHVQSKQNIEKLTKMCTTEDSNNNVTNENTHLNYAKEMFIFICNATQKCSKQCHVITLCF